MCRFDVRTNAESRVKAKEVSLMCVSSRSMLLIKKKMYVHALWSVGLVALLSSLSFRVRVDDGWLNLFPHLHHHSHLTLPLLFLSTATTTTTIATTTRSLSHTPPPPHTTL